MTTSYGRFFLSVTGLFCCLFIGYLCYSSYTLNLSQKRIKDYYINHINKADSLCFSISAYNTALIENIQKANNALLADSLIKYTLGSKQKLSKNQYKNLSTIISNHYNQSIKIQEQYQSKLSRDSLQLNAERTLLEGQTKAMIDLHLTKIDHEYNNITMWAAILTILFLVFSFYSIFKMDELIQQGNEGVKEIKNLKKEGKQNLDQLKTEKEKIVTNIQGQLSDSIAAVNNTQKETERQYQNAVINLNSAKDGLITESKGMLEDYKKQFDSILKKNNDNLEQKQKEFNDLVTQVNEILNKLNNTNSKKEE